MIASQFSFVASNISVEGDLPIEVFPGHIFRRARPTEVASIKARLYQDAPERKHSPLPYEANITERQETGHTSYHYDPVPEDQWRYFVLACDGTTLHMMELCKLALLLRPEIRFGFDALYSEPNQQGDLFGYSWIPEYVRSMRTVLGSPPRGPAPIAAAELQKLAELYELYRALPDDLAFVGRALKNYYALETIPQSVGLMVVGLFSVIESLVTHRPHKEDRLDTITNQVRTKLTLLNRRFDYPVNSKTYFDDAKSDTIWSALYAYRSRIAHGDLPDFKKKLHVLKNPNVVRAYLRESIRELLKKALHEPELLRDLRAC